MRLGGSLALPTGLPRSDSHQVRIPRPEHLAAAVGGQRAEDAAAVGGREVDVFGVRQQHAARIRSTATTGRPGARGSAGFG